MNLDPINQVKMAMILNELANYGVKIIISTHSDYLIRATTNAILKSKVEGNVQSIDTIGYYFSKNEVKPLGDLANLDYIDNFDDVNLELEDNYLKLKNEINEKESE